MRRPPLPLAVFLLLAAMLLPQTGRAAATSAHFGVHLTVRESCEIRADGTDTRAPAVNCRHGNSFSVSRPAARLHVVGETTARTGNASQLVDGVTPTWVVTF